MRDLIATLRKALKADHPVAPAPPLSVRSYRAEAVRLMMDAKCAPSAGHMTPGWTADRLLALQRKAVAAGEPHPTVHPVEVHALSLLLALRDGGHAGTEILAEDLERIYVELVTLYWWAPQRWAFRAGIAHAFNRLNGERNRYYRWVERPGGSVHRLTVYRILGPERAPASARRQRMRSHRTPIPLPPHFTHEAARVAA